MCSEAGILFQTRENSAKYLKNWNSVLVSELENDNRFFLKASAQSQKAVNYILGRNSDTEESAVKEPTKKIASKKPGKKKIKAKVIKTKKAGLSAPIQVSKILNQTEKELRRQL